MTVETPAAIARRRPPLPILIAISMLQPFALNVLAPATPALSRALRTDYATIQLTLTFYLVSVAVTQLVVGPVSDRVGRRPCVLAAIVLFLAGSVLGAFATSIEALLVARVVQAAGGGTCFALSRAMVRDTASAAESASLIGYITMGMVVAPMLAPLVGGFLDAHFGWRSIFAACAVLTLAVGLAAVPLLPETAPHRGRGSFADIAGGFPVLVRDRTFVGYTLSLAANSAAFFAFIAGAPYVVVDVMGRSADVYGVYFVGVAGGYMVGNFITGRFGRRLGGERLVSYGTLVSLVCVGVALVLAFLLPWTPATLFLPLIGNSVGNGMTIPGATASALSARPELAGTAAGILGSTQLGIGAGMAALMGAMVPAWPPILVVAMFASVALGLLSFRLALRRKA
ncbi:multidrug effflux MFS transporter [Salinarimonas soli]|uniref:Bcr/CflA family efflux transporter n=1 Tax=Salinarimonas soli TaxID=1638099 RepID=A0A5B2VI45_9HYPH|nr:multidrug effflux MFS transporter [Salinarimonas soli]KAA2238226.1 multidrug effflux MFS transporter [Salinarimonas soli]